MAVHVQHQQQRIMSRRKNYSQLHLLAAFLFGCCFATLIITLVHFSDTLGDLHDISVASHHESMHHPANMAKKHLEKILLTEKDKHQPFYSADKNNAAAVDKLGAHHEENKKDVKNHPDNKQLLAANHDSLVHPVAGLDCSEHGGPMTQADSKELVYWRDIPDDNAWVSPFYSKEKKQYLTFEPDGGGWNNIRMSMETVLTMALAMGRTLVLPPSQKMYLLGKTTFNFADFFPLQELAEEHEGLEIISTEQFLKETMGQTKDVTTGAYSFPPQNKRTNWDGDTQGIKGELSPWIRSVSKMADWNPEKCLAAFPKSRDPHDVELLQQAFDEIQSEEDGKFVKKNAYEHFIDKPVDVDAETKDRMREGIAERKSLCVYDQELQQAEILHFHGKTQRKHGPKVEEPGGRLLVHFYAFLFFQDWKTDLWTKRFVRDHVRYIDNIQCAAARIVDKLRKDHGVYDSFHIRRGDFQYKNTRLDAEDIIANSYDVIQSGRTVYIGTDERKKEFFEPMKNAGWNILFLDDFLDVVGKGIDPHYYGMIDQLVVSRGERFFGCWFSTFTGYIMRLRGYHSQAEIKTSKHGKEFEQGKLPNSFYYALKEHKTKMHQYWPVKKSFYAREFPTSWRQLDKIFEYSE